MQKEPSGEKKTQLTTPALYLPPQNTSPSARAFPTPFCRHFWLLSKSRRQWFPIISFIRLSICLQILFLTILRFQGRKLMVIGTTSTSHVLKDMELFDTFDATLQLHNLDNEEVKCVLRESSRSPFSSFFSFYFVPDSLHPPSFSLCIFPSPKPPLRETNHGL